MNRSLRPVRALNQSQRRSGLTTPAVAMALLVIMLGISLILDRLWLESAKLELQTAAESAALAAAKKLACDDLLKPNVEFEQVFANARRVAATIAAQNYVCGVPVTLNVEPQGDILFGQWTEDSSGIVFAETDENPNTVAVTALRTHSSNNPVALFIAGASGLPYGDVAVQVAATISNDVAGLRPYEGSCLPALPIGIWQSDPKQRRNDTWDASIEGKLGTDNYSFDEESQSVVSGGDGIPELMLHSLRTGGKTTDPNVQLLDIGTGRVDIEVNRQFESGISVDDLQEWDGALCLGQGAAVDFTSTPDISATVTAAFQKMIGERRICFLYSSAAPQHQSPLATTRCTEIVAVRILAVNTHDDGSCDVIIQPTVMTSKTVILVSEAFGALSNSESDPLSDGTAGTDGNSSNTASNSIPNRYLYKLQLTH